MAASHDNVAGSLANIPPPEERFVLELEFVQCLCNPKYLNFLAQRDYFLDKAFLAFLEYLKYWKDPRYARYVQHPFCLVILDLLGDPSFREALRRTPFCDSISVGEDEEWKKRHEKFMSMR